MTDYEGEHREPEDEIKPFWMSDKVYGFLKWVTQIVLPALATFYLTIGALWGLLEPEKVAATIVAVDTFLGVILMVASKSYQNSPARFDGSMRVFQVPQKQVLIDFGTKPDEVIEGKDEVLLQVKHLDQ